MSAIRGQQRSEERAQSGPDGVGSTSKKNKASTVSTKQTMPNGQSSASASVSANAAARQTPDEGSNKSRLVFGLSARTNRLKHDEYAEKRSTSGQAPAGVTQLGPLSKSSGVREPTEGAKSKSEIGIGTSTGTGTGPPDATSTVMISGNNGPLDSSLNEFSNNSKSSINQTSSSPNQTSAAKIRPSRLGNYYKPQDLLAPNSGAISEKTSAAKSNVSLAAVSGQAPKEVAASKKTSSVRSSSPSKSKLERSPDRSAASTVQASNSSSSTSGSVTSFRGEKLVSATNNDQQQAQILATNQARPSTRMQFNIPPPPIQSSSSAKSSVVSYAKSRIYDKPANSRLASGVRPAALATMPGSLIDSGAIPESILSGFKPPKQVNVSKAREKWEGGEPFAKCKSRQRLAAQAGKKLNLHGTWSMTSVVATQQLQLQQALAQSSAGMRSNLNKSDPSVKILTRGSVLERVQQFEKVPAGSSTGTSETDSQSDDDSTCFNSSSSSSSSISSGDGLAGDAVTSISNSSATSATEASLTIGTPVSKQASYKTRVSSLQSISNNNSTTASVKLSSSIGPIKQSASNSGSQSPSLSHSHSNSNSPAASYRRLSLRRRSSTNSSTQSIPKFYHPNGKPNTYEIEIQKRNIVACFDNLPDRKAQLAAGPAARRHFHSIALACGFTEYFKEPLRLYVSHHLREFNLSLQNTTRGGNRKESCVGIPISVPTQIQRTIETNGTKVGPANTRQLTKAASIDTSTIEKLTSQNYVTCEQFLTCWKNLISTSFDNAARFVHLLTLGQRNSLVPDDFVALIQSVIDDHPGLKFLRSAPDFHMRYIQTVIARIFYCVNKSWTGKISLAELRQSNLLAVLQVLSQEEDINQITDYFSYEHFYVIYCKFWSLDQDHDLWISKEDLARHNDAAISSRIIERIFMGIVSRQIQQTGKMSYTDFVWFLLAEEDKKHPRAIEYWFRLMDIDGDGYISMYEMEYFYEEQTKRLELMNIEALPFVDSACQILDLVNPKEKNKISLSDLKRTKMATIFFDTFINLEKYLEHESREFVSTRDVVQDGVVISDWDRYASEEYESLVTEESTV